jgi:hypothetical protein
LNFDLFKRWITRWEAVRYQAYDDATGKPITPTTVMKGKAHIGIGFDLEAPGARGIIAGLHLDYSAIRAGIASLTHDQVDQLLTITPTRPLTEPNLWSRTSTRCQKTSSW